MRAATRLFSSLVLAGGCALSFAGGAAAAGTGEPAEAPAPEAQAPESRAHPAKAPLAGIKVHFKLDPHLTSGLYMGERWVSPATYTSLLQEGREATVEARAEGLDIRGRRLVRHLTAEWSPGDPDMVTVASASGHVVRITVHRAGESVLEVRSGEVVKRLRIRATYREPVNRTQVEITQEDRR